jgi:rhodanese-related sulfurtransferase
VNVVSLAIAVDGFWHTMGVILFGTAIALLLASCRFAIGQALPARQELATLDPSQPTVVVCASGARSAIASTVLRAAGFRTRRTSSVEQARAR